MLCRSMTDGPSKDYDPEMFLKQTSFNRNGHQLRNPVRQGPMRGQQLANYASF